MPDSTNQTYTVEQLTSQDFSNYNFYSGTFPNGDVTNCNLTNVYFDPNCTGNTRWFKSNITDMTTANTDIFEAYEGFGDLFCGKTNCNWQNIVNNIGDPFEIISPSLVFKIYPCCSLSHSAIDIILDLNKEKTLHPDKIRKIKCGVDYRAEKTLPYHNPHSGLESKFSMEFSIAVSIVKNKADIY